MKTCSGGEFLLMWGASLCHYPLGPPVNLWTTSTVGQQFVLSVHCVKLVWVVSPPVTVILTRNVFNFWWMCIRVWCCYEFCDVSVSKVSSCGHTAKCVSTKLGTTQTPLFGWSWFKHLHCLASQVLLVWHGTDSSVELKIDISVNLCFKRVGKKSLQENEWHFPLCRILH